MRARSAISLAVITFIATSPASAAGPEDLLKAMVTCRPDFFTAMSADKTRFAATTIKDAATPATKTHPSVTTSDVVFASPVEVAGLTLVGYTQTTLQSPKRPATFWWGFRLKEPTDKVAKAIEAVDKTAEFQQQGDQFGWVQDVDPTWRHLDNSAIETQMPTRMVLIEPAEPDKTATLLRCAVVATTFGKLSLPKASDLFAAPSPAGGR